MAEEDPAADEATSRLPPPRRPRRPRLPGELPGAAPPGLAARASVRHAVVELEQGHGHLAAAPRAHVVERVIGRRTGTGGFGRRRTTSDQTAALRYRIFGGRLGGAAACSCASSTLPPLEREDDYPLSRRGLSSLAACFLTDRDERTQSAPGSLAPHRRALARALPPGHMGLRARRRPPPPRGATSRSSTPTTASSPQPQPPLQPARDRPRCGVCPRLLLGGRGRDGVRAFILLLLHLLLAWPAGAPASSRSWPSLALVRPRRARNVLPGERGRPPGQSPSWPSPPLPPAGQPRFSLDSLRASFEARDEKAPRAQRSAPASRRRRRRGARARLDAHLPGGVRHPRADRPRITWPWALQQEGGPLERRHRALLRAQRRACLVSLLCRRPRPATSSARGALSAWTRAFHLSALAIPRPRLPPRSLARHPWPRRRPGPSSPGSPWASSSRSASSSAGR